MDKEDVNIESILCKALSLVDAKDREAYLESACGSDSRLRAEVDSLLAAYEAEDSMLIAPPGLLRWLAGLTTTRLVCFRDSSWPPPLSAAYGAGEGRRPGWKGWRVSLRNQKELGSSCDQYDWVAHGNGRSLCHASPL